MMERRAFITGVAAFFAAPLAATAQAPKKAPRIGYLAPEPDSPFGGIDVFRQGLRELGYVQGQNIAITSRFTEGRDERARDLATELVHLGVDVIVARTTVAALAAQHATSTIPVVFLAVGDPVARGLVASIARPGGNLTGLASFSAVDLNAKRLDRHGHLSLPASTTVGTRDSDALSPPASLSRRWPSALGPGRPGATGSRTPHRPPARAPVLCSAPALEVARSCPRWSTFHEIILAAMSLSRDCRSRN